MAIDQYDHDFNHLVKKDFSVFMKDLNKMKANPLPMVEFSINGVGVKALCERLGHESDFPGCYVLLDGAKPIYVGISKSVLARLRQHVRGTTHFDASLAYRIAAKNMPHNKTRTNAMEDKLFKQEFAKAKGYLKGLNVAYVKIFNPLALYVFEPYCAMELNTSDWNTFETH